MKNPIKTGILVLLMLISSKTMFAQYTEITPLFGYTFAGKYDRYNQTLDVKDNFLYGVLADFELLPRNYLEFSYRRNDTQLAERNSGEPVVTMHDMGVEHYQLGYLYEFKEGPLIPFASIAAGTTRYFGKGDLKKRYWMFSTALNLGAKLFFNEHLGIRIQTNLTMPLEFGGAGFGCGIGTGGAGCGGDLYFNSPLVHWDLTAGLIFRFGSEY